jgi:hypothetical protein
MIVKTAQQGTQAEFKLDTAIQGNMLYDTMAQVHAAYAELTKALHAHADREAEDPDGDSTRQRHAEVRSLELLSSSLKTAGRAFTQLGAQVEVLKGADIVDSFIDRTVLGPEIRGGGNAKRVYIRNAASRSVPTHVKEEESGLFLFTGRTGEENDQAFVTIGVDELAESLRYDEGGGSKIMVSIDELDIYDDEGKGNTKQAPIEKEDN